MMNVCPRIVAQVPGMHLVLCRRPASICTTTTSMSTAQHSTIQVCFISVVVLLIVGAAAASCLKKVEGRG